MSWEDIIKRRIGRSYNLARLGVDGIRRDKVIDTFSDKNMAEKLSDEMNEMVADRNANLPEKFHSRFYVKEKDGQYELRQDAYSSEVKRFATGVLNIYRGRKN
tara:strand:+ start:709 stop:1017 length:309 start_codon:yes stop_codon:yes gene_type:complete